VRNLRADRKEDRQEQARERQADRDKRNPREQLALLDYRLGEGLGAKNERKRLTQQLEPAKEKPISATSVKKGKK